MPTDIIGKEVRLTFLDHALGCRKPITCVCYGIVQEMNDVFLTMDFWYLVGESEEVSKNNNEPVVVCTSTIISIDVVDHYNRVYEGDMIDYGTVEKVKKAG